MPAPLSGPGLGLQLAQQLYPTSGAFNATIGNVPLDSPTNRICLNAGDELPIPAGTWYVHPGLYCVFEWLDPVTGIWAMGPAAAWTGGISYIKSDGFTVRIANRTGCPVSASITNAGSSYVQASTTVVAAGGTSTWQPIVGGALTAVAQTTLTSGGGYGVAPLVLIPAPPPAANNANGVGGVQASAYAVIASGTVSGVTLINPGAGYQTGFTLPLIPNPTDPNIPTGITLATVIFTLTASGSLTGVLCTNPGAPITPANITLTVAGAGSSGSVTANVMQTVTAGSVIGGNTGPYGAALLMTSVGGVPVAGSITNDPNFLGLAFRPRPAQILLAVTGNNSLAPQVGTIYDGGLFLAAPTPIIAGGNAVAASGSIAGTSTLSFTMGSRADIVMMQPGP